MSRVWLLNPDAEAEIAYGGDYTTPLGLASKMAARRARFDALVQGEAARFVHELEPREGRGKRALLWCPTPSARRAARRAGFELPPAPAPLVLRHVLSREFLVRCGLPGPPGRGFLRDEDALHTRLRELGPGVHLRTKRAFGCAGRGHRSLRERLIKDDLQFLRDGLRAGGLLIEPELVVRREYSLHGLLGPERSTLLGEPCAFTVDAHQQPAHVERLRLPAAALRLRLRELGERAAEALKAAGYFGPFGIDVLEIAEPASSTDSTLYVSDLNARFTLGWSTGMGPQREEALLRALAE